MNDVSYFEWLLEIVGILGEKPESTIASWMYKIPYTYHFSLDENRKRAGLNLREEFQDAYGVPDDEIPTSPCSVFEVLVALARDFSGNADISVALAYAEICDNLCLGLDERLVWDSIEDWLNGCTSRDGAGTPFPLRHYSGDAGMLDLWSQMNIYIHENYPLRKDWLE